MYILESEATIWTFSCQLL